jgi:multiple sugar transport system ATP-binding protein
MNIVRAAVTGAGDDLAVEIGGVSTTLPVETAASIRNSGVANVVIGVRPEHVRLAPDGIPATVTVVESLGHERHVVCRLADNELVIVRQPASDAAPAEQERVHLTTDAETFHLFDAATGQRIDGA